MNVKNFGCERRFIERIPFEQNRLFMATIYCQRNFNFLNLVSLLYQEFDSNAILLFIALVFIFFAVMFLIAKICQKGLSTASRDLAKALGLSPTLAAATILGLANSSPALFPDYSVLSWRGDNIGNALFVVGILAFIVCGAVAFVSLGKKDEIQLPKFVVLKDFVFLFLGVSLVGIFALTKEISQVFGVMLICIFVFYVAFTILVDFLQAKKDEIIQRKIEKEENVESEIKIRNSRLEQQAPQNLSETSSGMFDLPDDESDKDQATETGFLADLSRQIFPPNQNIVVSVLLIPLLFITLFSIPHKSNPLKKNEVLRYIPYFLSTCWFFFALAIPGLAYWIILIIGGVTTVIMLVLHLTKILPWVFSRGEEKLTLLSSAAIIHICILVLNDIMSFLAFYFNFNMAAYQALVLPLAVSLVQLYQNACLSKREEEKLAVLSSYATAIFMLFVVLGIRSIMNVNAGEKNFELFFLSDENEEERTDFGINSRFFMLSLTGFLISALGFSIVYYMNRRFVLKKTLAYFLMLGLAAYVGGSVCFGLAFEA